ncbi:MAG: glycosyl transferase, partial [Chloroflexota bacterium]
MLLTSSIYVVFAFLLSYFGVEWLRQQLVQRAILDIPNQRSSHVIPTPKGGGLMIAGLTLGGLTVWLFTSAQPATMLSIYLLTGSAIAAIGWWDDLKPLPAMVRLGLQCACASAFLVFGLGW